MIKNVKVNVNLIILLTFLFSAYFIYVVVNGSGPGVLNIKSGDNSITIDFSGREYDFSEIMSKVMENERDAQRVKLILQSEYGLYDVNDVQFVDYLRRLSPDDEISKEIIALLIDGSGPFDYQFHAYRNIHSLSAALEIINSDYDSPAALRLREAADLQEGIFEPKGVPVRVSFAPDSRISDDNAAVCSNSRLRGRDLILINNRGPQERIVSVYSRNHFTCVGNGDEESSEQEEPLIQINFNTAKRLFGNIRYEKTEPAILYLVPLGYQTKANTYTANLAFSGNSDASGEEQ